MEKPTIRSSAVHETTKSAVDANEETVPPSNPGSTDDATIQPQSSPGSVADDATIQPQNSPGSEPAATIDSAGPRPVQTSDHRKVRYFGEYELLGEIARGGMGVVYKAKQVKLNRLVALKMILSGQLAGEEDVKRFHTEAEAAANLDHPGIVPIYEVGEHEGQHYFSMAFVEGTSLSAAVASGPLPPQEAAQIVKAVTEAMAYAHDRGVIHRDLKPANILLAKVDDKRPTAVFLTADGMAPGWYEPKVTDFGLAKKTEGDSQLTGTGQILGTPSYMPPEQAGGKTEEIGPLADVYSLGAILYCLLTGRPPFQSANVMDTLIQVLEKEPVPVRQLSPDVPVDLETICQKCLEKPADKRYASANELGQELERFLEGRPIVARPVGTFERGWRWCKRNRVIAALTMTVAVSLIVGIALSSYFAIESGQRATALAASEKELRDERNSALRLANEKDKLATKEAAARHIAEQAQAKEILARKDAQAQRELAEKRLTRSEWLLYASQITKAQLYWDAANAEAAWDTLNACKRDFCGWEHNYLNTLFNKNQQTLQGHTSNVTSVAFSPDGQRIVSGCMGRKLKVWDAKTSKEILTFSGHTSKVRNVAFSPDGKRIVSGSEDKTLKVWDAQNGQEIRTLKGHAGGVTSVAFSPDSKRIVSGSEDKTLKVWDAQSGQEIHMLKGHTGGVNSVAFSPDGNRIVSGSLDRTLKVWVVQSGQVIRTIKVGGYVNSVKFSMDGKRIVSNALKTVKVWDVQEGRELLTLKGHTSYIYTVAFSPDSKRIVSGSLDSTLKVWNAQSGQELLTLKGHTDAVSEVAFSPDGNRIVSGSWDQTLKIWNIQSGQETRTPNDSFSAGKSVAFSPDGKWIVIGDAQGTLTVWDARSDQETLTLKGHTGGVNSVAFSPDSKQIVSGSRDGTLKVWGAQSGQEILTLKGHTDDVEGVAFSPDGRRILSGSMDRTLKVWDAQSGQEILTLKGHTGYVNSVAYSPDGRRILSGSVDRTLKMWDAQIGQEILTLKGHTAPVSSVVFSPDGNRIVSGSRDRTLKMWDAQIGQEIRTLKGHTDFVMSVAFSPNGKRIVTGSADSTLKVWEAQNGQELLTLKGQVGWLVSVAFSPDGRRILSGSSFNTVRVWDGKQSSVPSVNAPKSTEANTGRKTASAGTPPRMPFEGRSLPKREMKVRQEEPEKPNKYQSSIADMFEGVVLVENELSCIIGSLGEDENHPTQPQKIC